MTNLSLMDHYLQLDMMGSADQPMLEGYTGLGYLAGLTSSVELQLLVTGVTYRHPGLLAKIVSRSTCSPAAGQCSASGPPGTSGEHLALGVPYPPLAERFERLEETLQIVRQMERGRRPLRGQALPPGRDPQLAPAAADAADLVGGGGEKKTLRLVAKYADRCNLFVSPDPAGPAAVAGKLDVLREHCRREGTDYDRIHKTVLYTAPLSPGAAAAAQFTDVLSAYAALGVTEVHVMPMDGDPVGFVRNLGEHVIPRVTDL